MRTIRSVALTGLLVSTALLAGTGQAIAGPYLFSTLNPVPGYQNAYATAINDSGQVVGISFLVNLDLNSSQATIWNGGNPTALSHSGFGVSQAFGINNAGQAVGGVGNARAVVWSGSTALDLGPGTAYAINDLGQIAGTNGAQQATIWNGTTPTTIGPGPDQTGGINSAGQIAGASAYDGVLWTGNVPTSLPGLGGLDSRALGINDHGVAVGYSRLPDNSRIRATAWEDGAVTDLGTLGGDYSRAWGINNDGAIVGDSVLGTDGRQRATLWTDNGPIDLNSFLDSSLVDEGWYLEIAGAINNRGAITGIARNALSGEVRGFVLTPVPEPESYALMLAGLGLVAWMARRHRQKSIA